MQHEPEEQFRIPDEALRYILYQRTAYLRLPVTRLYRHLFRRLPFNVPLYNAAVALEARVGAERVKALYRQDMRDEFASIRAFLPPSCASILDIGCGVAGIDVLLDRHYAGQQPDFYLLDRSEVASSVYYLFEPRGAFYNSFDVARVLLAGNGIAGERIHTLTASDRFEIDIHGWRTDLVISLLSWGFYYPVQAYARAVFELLADGGRVILDVRKGTGRLASLRREGVLIDVLLDTQKFMRVGLSR
jgi:hypothetical protein